MLKLGVVSLTLATSFTASYGCSVCSCSLSSDWAAQGYSSMEGFEAHVRYEYSDASQLRHEDRAISASNPVVLASAGETQKSTLNRVAVLGFDYASGGAWGVTVEAPYIDRDHTTLGAGDSTVTGSHASGLGDVRLLGRYQIHSFNQGLGFQFGLKLPTGGFHQNFNTGPEAGEPLDRGLQLGTGTTDLLAGVSYFYRVNTHVGTFASVMVDQPLAERENFMPSASLTVNAGVRLLTMGWLTPQVQVNTRFDGRERGDEADVGNSGGTFVYLSPGVTAEIGDHTSAFAFVQLPVYQRVNGVQLHPQWLMSLGIRYRL